MGELVGPQDPEHIRLILGEIDRPVQFAAVATVDDLRIVTGGDRIKPERQRLVQQRREL